MSSVLKDITNNDHAAAQAILVRAFRKVANGAPTNAEPCVYHALRSIALDDSGEKAAISPLEAIAELDLVHQRLVRLIKGMSVWMVASAHEKADMEMVQEKLRNVKILYDQGKMLHTFQEQLLYYQEKSSGDDVSQGAAAAEQLSVCRPSIFFSSQPTDRSCEAFSEYTQTPPHSHRCVNTNAAVTPNVDLAAEHKLSFTKLSTESSSIAGLQQYCLGLDSCNFYTRVVWPPVNPCIVVVVEFKRQRMKRCISKVILDPGMYVIVPGDRGYDCGLVVQCGVWSPAVDGFLENTLKTMDNDSMLLARIKGDVVSIVREATAEEVQRLYTELASMERLALRTCRDLVHKLELNMFVVDCEYQFDGTKISFYFEASHTIDFRELNKELFRIFNARIWMENVNSSVRNVLPEGALTKFGKAQLQCCQSRHSFTKLKKQFEAKGGKGRERK